MAEEFDSAHESSGSDAEMEDAGDDDEDSGRKAEPKKKKVKTSK